jgi:hypothetical protein
MKKKIVPQAARRVSGNHKQISLKGRKAEPGRVTWARSLAKWEAAQRGERIERWVRSFSSRPC